MVFKQGHTDTQALKTLEQKKKAFESFCAHVAAGNPQYSWYINEPDCKCTDETLLKYIAAEPDIFDTFMKDIAYKASYQHWFDKGKKMADGNMKGSYSPQVWQTIMRNMFARFGWWEAFENQVQEMANQAKDMIDMFSKVSEAQKAASKKDSSES